MKAIAVNRQVLVRRAIIVVYMEASKFLTQAIDKAVYVAFSDICMTEVKSDLKPFVTDLFKKATKLIYVNQ